MSTSSLCAWPDNRRDSLGSNRTTTTESTPAFPAVGTMANFGAAKKKKDLEHFVKPLE
jgi:hypothetical protein